MFTIKRRHYGTHNDWVRFDPEQEYEERRRKIQRQKLIPRERREVLNRLFDSWVGITAYGRGTMAISAAHLCRWKGRAPTHLLAPLAR